MLCVAPRRLPPLALTLLALSACGDQIAAAPDASVDAGPPPAQGSQPTGDLVINEVAARPTDGADWFEIANRGADAIDLCSYFVTDLLDRLDHYLPLGGAAPPDPCAPRMLAAGDYLVIYADDGAGGELDHAPFQLGQADEVHVADWTGRAADGLLYLDIAGPGRTLARRPDSAGLFYPAEPTPGAANPEKDAAW